MADESKASSDDIAFAKTLPPISGKDEADQQDGASEGAPAQSAAADASASSADDSDDAREGGLINSPTLAPPGHEDDEQQEGEDDADSAAKMPTADDNEAVGIAHAATEVGTPPPPKPRDDALHNLLAALVEQARALASRIAGDPERPNPCHFCGGPLALWENLLVLQLAGVPAHVACPPALLDERLAAVGPLPEFPYQALSEVVDQRVDEARPPDARSGTIEAAV